MRSGLDGLVYLGSSLLGSGFRVKGSGFRVKGSGFRVQRFRVQGSEFWVLGSSFKGSVQSPAKKRPVKSQKKLPKLIVLLLNVGAVFNRDLFGLANLYIEVSYKRCRWSEKRPIKSRKKPQSDQCRRSIDECRIKVFYHLKL